MDPHIFANPDPGSQNLADPADPEPDPKHCSKANQRSKLLDMGCENLEEW